MSGRRMNAEQRREQIISVATRLFADNGLDGTRFWQIASACGVSEGAVLHFFRDKESLHAACLKQVILKTNPTLAEMPEEIEKALKEYALRFLSRCRNDPDSLRFLLHINLSEPSENDLLYESKSIKGYFDQLETILERGRQNGQLNLPDVSFGARAFIGTLFFLVVLFEFYQADAVNRLSDEELSARTVELFLNGIANRDNPRGRRQGE